MENSSAILESLEDDIRHNNVHNLQEIIDRNKLSKSLNWIEIGVQLLIKSLEFKSHRITEFIVINYPELLKNNHRSNTLVLWKAASKINVRVVEIILRNNIEIYQPIIDTIIDAVYRKLKTFKRLEKTSKNDQERISRLKKILELLFKYTNSTFNKYDVTVEIDMERLNVTRLLVKTDHDVNKIINQRTSLEYYIHWIKVVELAGYMDNFHYMRLVYYKIVHFLIKHIVKMSIMNLDVSKRNLLAIDSRNDLKEYKKKCEKEIIMMKKNKIAGTTINVSDILFKEIDYLVKYAYNSKVNEYLKSDEFKIKYPLYEHQMLHYFKMASERKELLDDAQFVFTSIFTGSNYKLPPYCILEIFSYLENYDLSNFINCLD